MIPNNQINVSIVIPVYQNIQFTINCLDSIKLNTDLENNFEIIIVDNNSTDETELLIKRLLDDNLNLSYYKLDKNYGFAKACNFGAGLSRGKFLVFLNNDTEPRKGWIKYGIERLQSNKSIGIVGSKLLYPNGTIQHCGVDFFKDVNPGYNYWPLHRFMNYDSGDPVVNQPEEVIAVTGACLFIKKSLFEEVKGFDESYGMYFEDLDLNFKIRGKGYKVFYEPRSVVIHYEGKSSPNQDIIDDLNAKAAKIFFSKWNNEVNHIVFKSFIQKTIGNIFVLSPNLYPKSLVDISFQEDKEESIKEYLNFFSLIESVGDYYIHFGGAGDALLLLSTFYDENPNQTIISFANSVNALVSFFQAFPKLKQVFIIPLPPTNILHVSLRQLLPKIKNTKGMGATPRLNYFDEWKEHLNIFNEYGIREENNWAKEFKIEKIEPFQVIIAPKGSNVGMVGSKRNMLSTSDWENTIKYLSELGVRPIIVGTPEEEKSYPLIKGCIDKRSYSFEEQMKLIASSDLFIGADSWGKTFAALAGICTIVFRPLRGEDLKNWVDASEFVFIRPWKKIKLVKNFKELRIELSKNPVLSFLQNCTVIMDGPFQNSNSLSYVNAEIALVLGKTMKKLYFGRKKEIDTNFFKNDRYKSLRKFLNQKLNPCVTISHSFPPREKKPTEGKWIIIQPWEFGSTPKKWLQIFSQADEIWVPSSFVKKVYCMDGVNPEKVVVLPNGVNTSLFKKNNKKFSLKTAKKIKLLFVGGTIYRKGIDLLLKAYTEVFTSKDDICLVIKDVGTSTTYAGRNYSQQIKQIADISGVAEIEYISSHLPDEELVKLYNTCDFLVHPYRGEGFGLPILEAMACGMIPVVTRGGATDDFCDSLNSLQINSKKKYLNENKIDDMETVSLPWILEPDYEDLKRILKLIYNQNESLKIRFSEVHNLITAKWDWNTILNNLPQRIYTVCHAPIDHPLSKQDSHTKSDLKILIKELEGFIAKNDIEHAQKTIIDVFNIRNEESFDSAQAEILFNLAGNIFLASSNLEEAKNYFKKELSINQNSSSAYLGLGNVFISSEQYDNAKEMIEWAVKNDQTNKIAINRLAEVNELLGYSPNHNSLFENIFDRDRSELLLKNIVGLFLTDQYEDARGMVEANDEQLTHYVDNFLNQGDKAEYYNIKGFIYLSVDNDVARECFEKALSLNQTSSQACLGLGELFFRGNLFNEAKTMYEWAVKNDPNNKSAIEALTAVNVELGLEPAHNSLEEESV